MKFKLFLITCFVFYLAGFSQKANPNNKNEGYKQGGYQFYLFYKNHLKIRSAGVFIKRMGHSKNLLKANGETVLPTMLDSAFVWREVSDHTIDTLKAVVVENKLLFNTVTGEIKCYSMIPTTLKNFSIYFQGKDGKLYYNTNHFRKKILCEWVKDDADAFADWKKYRKRKMIRTYGPLCTAAIGISFSLLLSEKHPDASGLAFVGANLWPIWFCVKPIHPSKIIEKYNANKRKDEKFFQE